MATLTSSLSLLRPYFPVKPATKSTAKSRRRKLIASLTSPSPESPAGKTFSPSNPSPAIQGGSHSNPAARFVQSAESTIERVIFDFRFLALLAVGGSLAGSVLCFLNVRQVTKQYFILPQEEKQKCARSIEDWEGYGNDTIVSEHQTLDWNDRLYLNMHPEDQLKPNLWAINPPAFKETVQEYNKLLKNLFEILMKALARSLNLDENCFLSQHGELVMMAGRFNFYPCCAKPQSVLGTKPHADGTTFTMLLQDKEVEGLQVLKDDLWFRVPSFPDALLINAGDFLEIMSNGVLKSPVHRVVTNSESERISLAVFCFPDPDREVGPVDELVTEDQPQLYRRVKHYEQIFFEYYQLGQRPLSAVKL